MKVTLEKNYKEFYSLNTLDIAKRVIALEKDDCSTAKEWAEFAVREALRNRTDYFKRVIEAEATTARNRRIWDAYEEGTKDMDVWIDALAETDKGFIRVGAYLSDIWGSGATPYREHMFIQYYAEETLY